MMAQWLTSLAQSIMTGVWSPRTHVDAGQEWQPNLNASLRRQTGATQNKLVSQISHTGKLSVCLSILGPMDKAGQLRLIP